jgi:hypothetical protein
MAEVRQIPSAVGAFEAQVFDMGKTYRTIMTQEASRRKAQSDQKKELDKMMANTYAAKGKGRLQDMPELEKQYKELQDYYVNNGSAIMKGGQEFLEFQKKRSEFIFEAEQANLRKQRDQQLSPFFKLKLDKEGLSDKSNELMTIFNLPYNDPRRKNYQYEGSDGQMHGIDELNVTDIEKYTRFNEIDLIKNINTSAPISKVRDLTIEPSEDYGLQKGYKIAVTDEVALRDPIKISQAVTGTLASTPDARRYYRDMFQMESPEVLQNATKEMSLFNSIYKSAGYGQVVNLDNDGKPGVTNEVEYALYRNLKANLPQELGEKISTSLMTAQLGAERLDLSKRQFSMYKSIIDQNLPIDVSTSLFVSKLGEGNFGPKQIQAARDFAKAESAVIGNPYTNSGGAKPADVIYVAPGEKEPASLNAIGRLTPNEQNKMGKRGYFVYTIQTPMITGSGESAKPIQTFEDARKKGGDGYKYAKDKNNNVYRIESVRVPLDPAVTSPVVNSGIIKATYGKVQEAQQGNVMYDINWKRLQQGGGRQPLGLGIETGGPRGVISNFFNWGEQNYGTSRRGQ